MQRIYSAQDPSLRLNGGYAADDQQIPPFGRNDKLTLHSSRPSLSFGGAPLLLSFRGAQATRNLLISCSGYAAGEKQVPPFGRNDKVWRGRSRWDLASSLRDDVHTLPASPSIALSF